jgi:hypothetical protein
VADADSLTFNREDAMSWRHWTVVLAVISLGIVLQIPRHSEESMSDHGHPRAAGSPVSDAQSDLAGPYRVVALEVTGMT